MSHFSFDSFRESPPAFHSLDSLLVFFNSEVLSSYFALTFWIFKVSGSGGLVYLDITIGTFFRNAPGYQEAILGGPERFHGTVVIKHRQNT